MVGLVGIVVGWRLLPAICLATIVWVIVVGGSRLLTNRAAGIVITVAISPLRGWNAPIGLVFRRVGRTRRRRVPIVAFCWRCRAARSVAPELSKGIGLSYEASKLRERIIVRGPRVAAQRRFTCTERSLALFFRHSVPGYCARPVLLIAAGDQRRQKQIPKDETYRISSGALTPSNAKPEASTVTIPFTRASRAFVVSRSFWIMKRK